MVEATLHDGTYSETVLPGSESSDRDDHGATSDEILGKVKLLDPDAEGSHPRLIHAIF